MARLLITLGIVLVIAGLLWPQISPWLSRLGRLPGDILIRREGFTLLLPITSGLLVSLIISLILYFLRR